MNMSRKHLIVLSSITVGVLLVGIALFIALASTRGTALATGNASIMSKSVLSPARVASGFSAPQMHNPPPPADNVATQYVVTHYPGKAQARVLETEADIDRGVAVYDVRVLAPNGTIYVVHVQRSNNTVLWVNKAESQTLNPVDD